MSDQNFYNPGFIGGAAYMPQPIKPKMVNPLTPEERESLKVDNSFNLNVTPAEMAQAVCTHKDPVKGEFAIVPNGDGTCTCSICHATFNPNQVDGDYVTAATETAINALETCKLMGLDMNPDVIRNYYQMIPFLKKLPQLYKLSNQSFNRYNQQQPVQNLNQPSYFNALNFLANPTVPMASQYGYGYAPQMGQPPMMTPMMGMQQQMVPGGNPFYAQPQAPVAQAQQPVQPVPPVYQPQAPVQPVAPATGETVVKEAVQL